MLALFGMEPQNEYSVYVPELEVNNFTSDRKNKEVKVKQLYKDKLMLVSVITKYALDHNFNFKSKRSDKKGIIPTCLCVSLY